ncbi:hypothetical protein [Spirillospora sp. NBC_01491]|uniref:hypothetical protein n=1 Tax=Spirillospora sp. NBC_01491 TaxID=2976007 RepID=UPI002E37BA07|nr:hypothetical protein [Spirillospora sp. NBC_01491]
MTTINHHRAPIARAAVLAASAVIGATTMTAIPGIGWNAAAASSDSATAQRPTTAKAAPCWASGGRWWCNNRPGAAVWAGKGHTIVGKLNTGRNWFSYRCEGGRNNNGPHPTRWAFTKADNGRWGWVKDGDILNETNSLPNHGRCRWE